MNERDATHIKSVKGSRDQKLKREERIIAVSEGETE
jgi:hypothetical protein